MAVKCDHLSILVLDKSTIGRIKNHMKGADTKERLLHIGLDQTSVHGLGGVTLGQLASASGLSKSGLFAHFRSKEQLQIDLLDVTAQLGDRVILEPAMAEAEGLPRLIAAVDLWFGWSGRAGLSGGCPVAGAIFELDDIDGDVRNHAAKIEARWREQLSTLVLEARFLGHLSADTDIDQFVWELYGIYLSHHVSSRFLRDVDATVRAKAAFNGLVRRHQPPCASAQG
jgi:AcrR family transcriptional regulator